MFAERFSSLRNRLKYELDWLKESNRFNKFFAGIEDPNGILTKAGEEIYPLHRGLITVRGSFRLMKKAVDGKTLSDEERKRVREAAWLTSLTGNYTLDPLPEGGIKVGITLESNEARSYLSNNANIDTMVAFLSYRDTKHFRFKESSSIKTVQQEDNSHIIFDFPGVNETPTVGTRLFVYTRPLDVKNIDPRFLRISLLLGFPKSSDA